VQPIETADVVIDTDEPEAVPTTEDKPLTPMKKKSSIDMTVKAIEVKEKIRRASVSEKPEEDDLYAAYKTDDYKITLEEFAARYKTDLVNGLDDAAYKAAVERWGLNKLTPRETDPTWKKVLRAIFSGFFNILLWAGAILSLIGYAIMPDDNSNLAIGITLAVVVTITGLFSFFQESKSEAIMEGFKNFLPEIVAVFRNGDLVEVEAENLVPGDLVDVKFGDKLPADVRVVKCSSNLQVDNSALTGESEPQNRNEKQSEEEVMEAKNMMFFGTMCVKGTAKGVVINTGDRTVMGRIAKLADSTEQVDTPIAREINDFVHKVSMVAIFLGVTFFIVAMVKNYKNYISHFVFIIGIIVANVPEGLLATVTVSLSLTATRMATKNVLVKNLEAVETLGSTSVICSDKTGTLTTNVMTVSHLHYDLAMQECDTAEPLKGSFDAESKGFRDLTRIAMLCNNATYTTEGKIKGDASETALLKFSNPHYNNDAKGFRAGHAKVFGIPFNSGNKWQLSIHDLDEENYILVLKGASEKVVNYCKDIQIGEDVEELTEEHKAQLTNDIATISKMGERVLGFCMAILPKADFEGEFEGDNDENCNFPMNGDLTYIGMMSMIDPPRPGVPEAVANCQTAGIRVIMVTGDHPLTAQAIARKVGIIGPDANSIILQDQQNDEVLAAIDDPTLNAVVVHGTVLEKMTDNAQPNDVVTFWNKVLANEYVVFARTSPAQKLLIVNACQQRGGIVAVTGDGVNDSPALKKADIGVAMGITGTDVSKDAADMILLDDNFASIVKGIEEGRIIFDNLKKSIAYTLSSNIPEISPFLLYTVAGFPLPLSTPLILCVDLGTDMAPAISMAYEGKESNIMTRKPRDPARDNLVTWRLVSFAYLQIGILQALAGFYAYMVVLWDGAGIDPRSLTNLDGDTRFERKEDILYCCAYNACVYVAPDQTTWPETTKIPPQSAFYTTPGMNEQKWKETCTEVVYNEWPVKRLTRAQRVDTLKAAQTAYFISIIVVQWADLMICKTRTLSIFTHGMNNSFMNKAIVFETILGAGISYLPFINVVGTRPLKFVWWCSAIPFNFFIFLYDECRKAWIRKNPKGWLQRTTYW